MSERITSLLLIAVVALGTMTGVAAADGHLEVAVEDADDEPTVTVTQNDTAVENATVVVSVVNAENESYAGSGKYQTDANGIVDLPAPEEDVTVDVTASDDERTVSTTVELTADEEEDEEEDDTAEGTPFGQLMRDFIENIGDREGGIGAVVSDFATENNPGNASDDAGGGNDDDGNASDAPGNAPEGVGNASDDGERGPPDHAGPDGDDAEDDETEADDTEEEDVNEDDAESDEDDEDDNEDDDAEEDDDDDGKSGPPDRAGGPGDN